MNGRPPTDAVPVVNRSKIHIHRDRYRYSGTSSRRAVYSATSSSARSSGIHSSLVVVILLILLPAVGPHSEIARVFERCGQSTAVGRQ
jgi:hypothetical protein